MNRALLVIAHGSRRDAANQEFRQQVAAIAERVPHHPVEAAFLELAEPGIVAALQDMAGQGASRIDVFPLFLNAGKHVSVDIPEDIEQARQALPGVEIQLLDYLGRSERLPELVASLVNLSGHRD